MALPAAPLLLTLLLAAAPPAPVSPTDDPVAIIRKSVALDRVSESLRANYTWKVLRVNNVPATHSELVEVLPIGDRSYRHLLARNGQPLTGDEAIRAQQIVDNAIAAHNKLSPSERARLASKSRARRSKEREELSHIPDAFDFKIIGDVDINGRPAWQIEAHPKKQYSGPNASIFHNMEGTLWIDKQDYQWVKIEADVLNDISFGWFIAKIAKGTLITFENGRVNDEIWAMKRFSLKASARVVFKKINVNEEQIFSDYRKFQTDSRIVSAEELPPAQP